MATPLADRHVVVTGGTGALGTEVVRRALELGAACHVPVLRDEEIERFPLADHPRVSLTPGTDLRDEASATGYFDALPPIWASLHIAGGFDMAPVERTPLRAFEAMWRMNTVTCFLCCREAVRRFDGPGRIVNVAACAAADSVGGMIAYTTAKAGVISITRCLARELEPRDIRVNAIAPSIIDTPANRSAMPDADHDSWPSPAQLALRVCEFASPDPATPTGTVEIVRERR